MQATQVYPEMEYWKAFLVKVSSHTRVFVWFSTLIFLCYQMLFMNRLEFFCFADFCKDY